MSLTSELSSQTPIRRYIDRICDLQPISRRLNKALKSLQPVARPAYPDFLNFSLVGTAADLRFRAFFGPHIHMTGIVHNALRSLGSLLEVEQDGIWTRNPWRSRQTHGRPAREPIGVELKKKFDEFLTYNREQTIVLETQQEIRLASFCLLFARIVHGYRGLSFRYLFEIGTHDIEKMLRRSNEPEMLQDLLGLTDAFRADKNDLIAKHDFCHPGSVLTGSADVGGADFDIVIDQTLWEFKTTIKSKITTHMLRQLVGYWLLDYDDEYRIDKVAIYLARQRYTVTFDILKDLISPDYAKLPVNELRAACRATLQSGKH